MIFLACLLTVLIEGSFFALFGRRDRFSMTVIVCANVITNLLKKKVIGSIVSMGKEIAVYAVYF